MLLHHFCLVNTGHRDIRDDTCNCQIFTLTLMLNTDWLEYIKVIVYYSFRKEKKWEYVWTIMTEISNFFHIYDLWSWQQGKNSPLPHSCCISDIHLKTPQFLTILCKIYIYKYILWHEGYIQYSMDTFIGEIFWDV